MIDNVVFIVIGMLYERDVYEFFEKCYFLGMFDRCV